MYRGISSFEMSPEMSIEVNKIVDSGIYRSKSDLIREGIKMAIQVSKTKERLMKQVDEQIMKQVNEQTVKAQGTI